MKTLKRAEQRNVLLDRGYYTITDLRIMAESGNISVFDLNFNYIPISELDFMYESDSSLDDCSLRVMLGDTTDIKVIYNKEFGKYENVVVMKDGSILHINL